MQPFTNRRGFLGTALAAGAITGAGTARAESLSSIGDIIRVGAIALGEESHMNADSQIWAPTINPVNPDLWPVRSTNMVLTHCWDSRPEIARKFADTFGCEAVERYDGMVGKVDAMIFGGFLEAAWWVKLTKPYLEAGIPCFINRPFAASMRDARDIVETARRHNTPILCTDERECIREAIVGRAKVEQLLREKKIILGAVSQNATVWEYPQHGTHGIYYILAMFGTDVERIGFQANGWWKEVTPTSAQPMQWGNILFQYRGIDIPDAGRQEQPFLVTQLQLTGGTGAWANTRIYYKGGWWDNDGIMPGGDRTALMYYYQFPVVFEMQRMFTTRIMKWSYDYILDKTRVYLAGFWSHLEHNGALVNVADLPDDWTAPSPYPDWIDDNIFS